MSLELIGSGGFGKVFLTKDKNNKKFVIKTITLIKDTATIDKIMREVDILSKVNHKNVIKYINHNYTENETLDIKMEYANGGTLECFILNNYKNCFMPENEIIFYFTQILCGMEYLHDMNIIHRDLKLNNILLTGPGSRYLKLADFGLSKVSSENNSGIIGTPSIQAPEILLGKSYSQASDVWSLGCILHGMASKDGLWGPKRSGLGGLVFAALPSTPPKLPDIYSKSFNILLKQLLQPNPKVRPSVQKIIFSSLIIPTLTIIDIEIASQKLNDHDRNLIKSFLI